MEREKIEISQKHIPLRIAAFVLAFVVAVGSITAGVLKIGKKGPGYRTVETDPDETAPLYATGVTLTYAFSGSGGEIKTAYNALRTDYGTALCGAYKLLDAESEYVGLANAATLDRNRGETFSLDPRLYAALEDALEKTERRQGYNLFAGALFTAWGEILSLAEPQEFDPLHDPFQAERLERLARATEDLSNFTLALDPAALTACFTVSPEYEALLRELEISSPVLDFNLLREAYELTMTAAALEEKGWTAGYLTTEGGLTLALSGQTSGEFVLYGNAGEPAAALQIPVTGGAAASALRAFPLTAGELGYYAPDPGNGETLRHAATPAAGEGETPVISVIAVSRTGDAAEAAFACVSLMTCHESGRVGEAASALKMPAAYILAAEPGTVVRSPAALAEDGWTAASPYVLK